MTLENRTEAASLENPTIQHKLLPFFGRLFSFRSRKLACSRQRIDALRCILNEKPVAPIFELPLTTRAERALKRAA
jgi:hypothetical protein